MFAWTEKRRLDGRSLEPDVAPQGANRRAIGLVPLPVDRSAHEIPQAPKYRELMVSLEGNQTTGCLRVVSPKTRSRAAMLLFRGRVLGCIYGRRSLGHQAMGLDAHFLALADLAQPDNMLDAYHLSEDLVLASASLFHGVVLTPPTGTTIEKLEWTVNVLIEQDMPGVVVISTSDNLSVCMIYVFRSKIVGVYSFRDGWIDSTLTAALPYLKETPQAKISASMLTARSIEEVNQVTFSLTGLADRRTENWTAQNENSPLLSQDERGEALRTTWQLQTIGGFYRAVDPGPRATKTSSKFALPKRQALA